MPDVVFDTPEYLLVLPVVAALWLFWLAVYFLRLRSRPIRTDGSSYPVVGHIKFWFFVMLTFGLTAVAAARPSFAHGTASFQRSAADVVIVVDGSASMWLRDVTGVSRLEIAARELLELHHQNILTSRDRVALFVFGSTTGRKLHLSTDPGRFIDSVGRLRQPAVLTGDAFPWSSDIASTLEHVYHSLDNQDRVEAAGNNWNPSRRSDRLILLVTDGDFAFEGDQVERLEQALAECRRRGLTIYSIGIGSRAGRELTEVLRDYQSGRDYDEILAAELGEEQRSRLVTEWLTLMEQRTGGKTFVIGNAGATAAPFIRSAVDAHRSISFQLVREESKQEVWKYVLALAIVVFGVAVLFY